MGRKRKVYGKRYGVPGQKPVRLAIGRTTETNVRRFLGLPTPRGKTGKASRFTDALKEFAPLVYAFLVEEFKKPPPERSEMIMPIVKEWQTGSGSRRQRPPSRDLAAFVIERALGAAWEVWGIKRPFSAGDPEEFRRWYVHGHPGALRQFTKLLREIPGPPERGCWVWLPYFFGSRGDAAREFNLLTRETEPWTAIISAEEDTPPV